MKSKYNAKAKLCYTDADIFICHIKIEGFYKDISDDVNKRVDTSNYPSNINRLLPTGKNKKIPGFMKDQLGAEIIKEFVAPRAKTYSCFMDEDREIKKTKEIEKQIEKQKV